jgi:hypothetical protein
MARMLPYRKPFIDFHTHIFPDKLFQAIIQWFKSNAGWEFYFNGGVDEIVRFLDDIPNLEKFVCFGYAHKPGIARKLNEFYSGIRKLSNKAIPLGCVHQDDEDIVVITESALADGLPGFKLHCQVQQVTPFDTRLHKFYDIVAERNAFILFHAGTGPFPNEYGGFDNFKKFLKKFPKVKSVVAHLGCFEPELFLKAASDYENLFLDTSYTFVANPTNIMTAPAELIEKAQDRIFFASDFPGICHSYEKSVEAITDLGFDENVNDKLFHENAASFMKSLG